MATRVSTLNPNAPLFVPAAMAMAMAPQQHQHQQQRRVVEEFSSEWWSLVQTCPEFREQWMRDRLPAVEQQQMFQADLEELADLDAFLQYQQEMEAATTHDEPSWNFDDVDASITGDDVEFEPPAAMRSLIVVTATMKLRIPTRLSTLSAMIFQGTVLRRSSARFAITSKMQSRCVKIVAIPWVIITAPSAIFLMTSVLVREQYHCDACGICRIGGRENFFHCDRCGSCYSIALQNGHPYVENAMHQNCPVCIEYLFDSVMDISVLPCGHTMHQLCLGRINMHSQFMNNIHESVITCPKCSKSTQDMSRI